MRKFASVLTILLILCGIFSIIGFAATEELEIIKIGLQYSDSTNADGKPLVLNQTDTHFEFGQVSNNQYMTLVDFNQVNKFYYDKDNLYHVAISGFADYASAKAIIDQKGLSQAFVVKDKAYSVYSQGYDSSTANAEVIRWQSLGLQATLKQPSKSLVILKQNSVFFGYDASCGEFLMAPAGGNLKDKHFTFNGTGYRGGIGAKRQNTTDITLINYIHMDEYLYGVVPKEMSKNWPIEALKAQAVVARNFALVNQNKFMQYGFNLDNTTTSQAYGGFDWEGPISNQAVDETVGIKLMYDHTLVSGYYHSNSGGYTENSENVWSAELPYIKGVYDPFSLGAPNDAWSVEMTKDEIEQTLSKAGYQVGSLKNFYVSDYTDNNRVYNARFVGTTGSVDIEKQKIRGLFGYNTIKSTLLTVTPNNAVTYTDGQDFYSGSPAVLSVVSGNGTVSTINSDFAMFDGDQNVQKDFSADSYTISGKGWGHGLGMSQWGAKQMADQGFEFDQILTFYYTGTHIE